MKLDELASQELLNHIVHYQLPKKVSRIELILKKYFDNITIEPIGDMTEFEIAKMDKVAWNTKIVASNTKGNANVITYLVWN